MVAALGFGEESAFFNSGSVNTTVTYYVFYHEP